MDTLITSVTSIFTAAMGWAGTTATTVTNTPILLMFVVVPLVGLGVGMFKRLLSVR